MTRHRIALSSAYCIRANVVSVAYMVVNRKWKMAWSVFRFFPKTSVGFSRFEPNKAKNETEQFSVGFSVGSSRRFLVKPNEMVSVWKGSISLGWHDVRYDRICVSVACVCFHVKPFFLPVDIQQNQCLCRFFNTKEIQVLWSQTYATEILNAATYPVSTALGNAMPCDHTWYNRNDIHILWNRKTKGDNEGEK